MAQHARRETWQTRKARWVNRAHARWAARAKPAGGFTSQPEPRSMGSVARGRQLVSGNFLFAGYLVEGGDSTDLWALPVPAPRFESQLHGFGWLDDLAAVGTTEARLRAQTWTWGWISRYARGHGPGWTPDLTGRRLIRWINHALFLLRGRSSDDSRAYFAALGSQAAYLSRRWKAAVPGLPRFEALCGLIYAGLSLEGLEPLTNSAMRALERDCEALIDTQGGLPTRNPEELLEVLTLLTWVIQALAETGRIPSQPLDQAVQRIVPTLRALRHADGGLARFHGGGRGMEGRLDQALAAAQVRVAPLDGLAMGYARLSGGRTSVVMDASAPPAGIASVNAHACTLAFELTSARRPLIVNCGSGAQFGETWRKAGRATPSHSTLGIDGLSSARITPAVDGPARGQETLTEAPRDVRAQRSRSAQGQQILVGHDGYVRSHGLTHVRQIALSRDGRALSGEDTLGALTDADRAMFEQRLTESRLQGVPFSIRFHLHPDVDAEVDMNGNAVSLALRSGEIWVFRHDDVARLTLEPSVYLESGRLKPRATRQIVLSDRVTDFARQIGWTFAKAQDTPLAVRDFAYDDEDLMPDTEPS